VVLRFCFAKGDETRDGCRQAAEAPTDLRPAHRVSETRLPAIANDATKKVIASPHARYARNAAEIARDKRRQDEVARADWSY